MSEPAFSLGASIVGGVAMMLLGPPAVAWAMFVASTDEDAHVKAWHAHRDAEFQRDFNKRKRVVRRPFNRA